MRLFREKWLDCLVSFCFIFFSIFFIYSFDLIVFYFTLFYFYFFFLQKTSNLVRKRKRRSKWLDKKGEKKQRKFVLFSFSSSSFLLLFFFNHVSFLINSLSFPLSCFLSQELHIWKSKCEQAQGQLEVYKKIVDIKEKENNELTQICDGLLSHLK